MSSCALTDTCNDAPKPLNKGLKGIATNKIIIKKIMIRKRVNKNRIITWLINQPGYTEIIIIKLPSDYMEGIIPILPIPDQIIN